MRYISQFVFIVALVFVSGCASTQNSFVHHGYHSTEFLTKISNNDEFADIVGIEFRDQEFDRLSPQFNFDKNKITNTRHVLSRDHNTLQMLYEHTGNTVLDLYQLSGHRYTLNSVPDQDNLFVVSKDDTTILTSRHMTFGAESAIQEFGLLDFDVHNDSYEPEFFIFYDHQELNNEPIGSQRNIWFNGSTINEQYDLEDSSFLFQYDDKIGFVAGKNAKKFIMYDGIQVSEGYDEILTFSCCSISHYPLQIDTNGNFLFLAQKGKKYFFVEVKLTSPGQNI